MKTFPHGHELSAEAKKRVQCQMSPGGKRCVRFARFCGYRAGPAYDYFCKTCWEVPGPDGMSPKERAEKP